MPTPDERAAADERLASAVDELIRAADRATAVLRATSVAVGEADEGRTALFSETAAAQQAQRDGAAAEHLAALRQELAEDLSGLPAAAMLDLDSADWGQALAQPPTVVPRVLRVGTVVSPAGADVADALVPNPMLANITLRGGTADRALLLGVVESLLVRALVTAPSGSLRVHVLDPHHSGTSLSRFGIADTASAGIFGTTAVTSSDIHARLDQLKNRVATVSQRFLQGTIPDLETYNATADVREEHHLVVALDVPSYGSAELAELLTLARTGGPSGVHVLALVHADAPRRPDRLDLGPLLHTGAGLVASDGLLRLSGMVQDHGVVVDPPPDSDLVHAVMSTARARVVEGSGSDVPIEIHDVGRRDYGDHLEGMLAHLARAAAEEADAGAAGRAQLERYAAERKSLVAEIDGHVQQIREDLEAVRAPVGHVAVGLANRLESAVPAASVEGPAALPAATGEGPEALPAATGEGPAALPVASGDRPAVLVFDLGGGPRLVVDDVLRPVEDARRRIHDAITAVHTARAAAHRADRMQEWRRARRRGLGRDAVVVGIAYALGTAFLVDLYWTDGPIGPFHATILTLLVSGLVAGWVTVCRSWAFARLAERPDERGGLQAFHLMWGIALLMYGPAPRPVRYDIEKFLFAWLDSATVVVAPVVGAVLCVCALRNVRALFRDAGALTVSSRVTTAVGSGG